MIAWEEEHRDPNDNANLQARRSMSCDDKQTNARAPAEGRLDSAWAGGRYGAAAPEREGRGDYH